MVQYSNGRAKTEAAVAAWTAALPATDYDLRLIPSDDNGSPVSRRYDRAQLLRSIPFLRAQNAGGMHVYARPNCSSTILVDDLDEDGLHELRARHRIAAVVETSPANHQAWVRVADEPIPAALATAAARLLARRYGGDLCAARSDQVGRLAGFTNRKWIHLTSVGLHPFAMLREAQGGVDPGGGQLLETAAALAHSVLTTAPPPRRGLLPMLRQPEAEWREAAARIVAGLPRAIRLDRSRVDHAIAVRLLHHGAGETEVAAILRAGPRASAMRDAMAEAYIRRTLQSALSRTTGIKG